MEVPVGEHGLVLVPVFEAAATGILNGGGRRLVQAEHGLGRLNGVQSGPVDGIWREEDMHRTTVMGAPAKKKNC